MSDETIALTDAESRQFTPIRRTRLSTVSRDATLAERVEALEEEASKLGLLLEMSQALSSEKELDDVMKLIVDHTSRIVESERSSVFLLDKQKNELYSLVAQGLDVKELRLSVEAGIAGYVVRHCVGLNVPDAYKDSRFNPLVDKATGFRTASILCMPLHDRRGEILGAIECLNKKGARGTGRVFTTKDEIVLSAVAAQAAVYLDNARLRHQMDLLFESFVEAISRAIEDRDPCTSGHSRRVMIYSLSLARAIHESSTPPFDSITYTRARLRQLRYACLLHDVGKIGVREHILCKATRISAPSLEALRSRLALLKERCRAECLARALEQHLAPEAALLEQYTPLCAELDAAMNVVEKVSAAGFLPDAELQAVQALHAKGWITAEEFHNLAVHKGNLTEEELADMRSHVDKGFRMLSQIPWLSELQEVPEVALTHHERCDGSGYPRKLKKDEIHLDGQILCVTDMYDALTATDRPYKRAIPHEKAKQILEDEAAHGRIMPELVSLFFTAQCYKATEQETAGRQSAETH
ncbi:MAG: GAF domain-containing protein [Planctomycetota bacterium]|nr:GAF domain-containing protein [Planctomycetota bacterium]